jgi:murein DD-endopeptidase MepM/ murein hydrolase activator NlpD
MTGMSIKVTAFAVLAGGLAACATSPHYPIATSPAAAPPPATAPEPAQPPPPEPQAATPEPAPAPVDSQPLPPVPSPAPTPTAPPVRPSSPPPAVSPPPAPVAKAEPPTRYTATGKVVAAKHMYRVYTVVKGDHLDAIARDLETTRDALIEANHLDHPAALRPGQHLKIPIDKAYVVEAGDTLPAVARRFDVSPEDLADLNAMPVRQRLRPGDELALPGVFHDHGPVPIATMRLAGRHVPGPWVAGRGAGASPTPFPIQQAAPTPELTDDQVMQAGRGRFVWPVHGAILAPFGVEDVGRRNDGLDIKAPQGEAVRAAAGGDVVYAGDQVPGFGNLVLVKHADGWVTAYAHLDKVAVKMRDTVEQGQAIGSVGQSGGVAEPQLHFEIRYAPTPLEKARPIDPALVLPK